MKRWPLLVMVNLSSGAAVAGGDPALARLEHQLPAGWSLRATDKELVIRRDHPCTVKGVRHENERVGTTPSPSSGGPEITLELRYRLEPAWSDKQLAAGRAANIRLSADMRALRTKYAIDSIHTSKGRPLPANDDERQRLASYEREEPALTARTVLLPRCTLGTHSLFDSDDTYRQLQLQVDPASAMKEAFQVIAAIDKACPTKP